MRRPYATGSHGTGAMLAIIQTTATTDRTVAAAPRFPRDRAAGANIIRADIVASAISRRWQFCVPIHGIRMMLNARAPKTPPTVLTAYTLPARVPES